MIERDIRDRSRERNEDSLNQSSPDASLIVMFTVFNHRITFYMDVPGEAVLTARWGLILVSVAGAVGDNVTENGHSCVLGRAWKNGV